MNDLFEKATESYKNIYSQLRVSVSILSLFVGICFFLIKYAALVNAQNEHASLIYSILFFAIVFIIASITFLIMALDELHNIDNKNGMSQSVSLSIVKTYKSLALLLLGVLFEVVAAGILIFTSIDLELTPFLMVLFIASLLILLIIIFPKR